jgi:hypothetical protein
MKSDGTKFVDGGQLNPSYGVNSDAYLFGDMDADGKDDVLVYTNRVDYNKSVPNDLAWYLMKSVGSNFIDGGQINPSFGVSTDFYYPGDFNGDKKVDMMVATTRVKNNGELTWFLMKSDGTKFVDGGMVKDSWGVNNTNTFMVGDVDADKISDLYMGVSTTSNLGTYTNFTFAKLTGSSLTINNTPVIVKFRVSRSEIMDFTGDGKGDYFAGIYLRKRGNIARPLYMYIQKGQ